MIYNENITLDLNTNTSYVVVGAKQGDSGRTITAKIMDNGNLYSIDNNITTVYRIRKPSGAGIWNEATAYPSNSSVVFTLSSQDLSEAGQNFVDISFMDEDTILSTVNFIIDVKPIPNLVDSAVPSSLIEYFHAQKLLDFINNNGNMIIAIASNTSQIQSPLNYVNNNGNVSIAVASQS